MPSKRHTKKDKNQQKGTKQKNTTFKKKSLVGERKSLDDALGEKLTPEFIQNLVDNPNKLHSIQIEYCSDNNFVVNTNNIFDTPFDFQGFTPEGTSIEFKNMDDFTIPDDLQVGKQLEIVMYASEDGPLMYGTRIQEITKTPKGEKKTYHQLSCVPDKLPVIYSVPKITTPENISSEAYLTSVIDTQSGEEEALMDDIPRDSLSYDEVVTPDVTEQASINMGDLQVDDLEDVTDIAQSSAIDPTDVSKEIKESIKDKELEGVSEKPELKNFKDDLDLLKKKPKDTSAFVSREEGDINTTNKRIDFRELAKQEKEAKQTQQKETDRLAHEARLKAEEEAKKKQEEDIDDESEMMFEDISDSEAKEEEQREQIYQKFERYINEIEIIKNVLHSIITAIDISKYMYRDHYRTELEMLFSKYKAFINNFIKEKDDFDNIDDSTKDKIVSTLTNNLMLLKSEEKPNTVKFFPKKLIYSSSVMEALRTFFTALSQQTDTEQAKRNLFKMLTPFKGGKKTRKNRRKTKQRKTKKRT